MELLSIRLTMEIANLVKRCPSWTNTLKRLDDNNVVRDAFLKESCWYETCLVSS